MATVRANGLAFEVEFQGSPNDPAVLLIMGLGMQLTGWPDPLVERLVAERLRVIRFDNRDSGLSSRVAEAAAPNLVALGLRRALNLPIVTPYGLEDMADDGLAILDALGIERAHVVGASMGGMVAQLMAAKASERLLSLTSIMSTSGAPGLPRASARVLHALLSRPGKPRDFETIVAHYVRLFRLIGSPGFPTPEAQQTVAAYLKRSYDPSGSARQMAAILADGDRSERLKRIRVPTLVIHGTDDPLLPFACGEDTARKIAGATLLPVPGMGHDLAPGLWPILHRALVDHFTPNSR